jgi:hypothetical protein
MKKLCRIAFTVVSLLIVAESARADDGAQVSGENGPRDSKEQASSPVFTGLVERAKLIALTTRQKKTIDGVQFVYGLITDKKVYSNFISGKHVLKFPAPEEIDWSKEGFVYVALDHASYSLDVNRWSREDGAASLGVTWKGNGSQDHGDQGPATFRRVKVAGLKSVLFHLAGFQPTLGVVTLPKAQLKATPR